MVGFFKSSDSSGWSRSTNRTNDLPKASTRSGDPSASGKWSLVPEATPLLLWQQAGQPALFKIG